MKRFGKGCSAGRKMGKQMTFLFFPVAGLGWFFAPEAVHACATCFGDESTLAGYTVSWLFLLLMPFAVIGSIGVWMYRIRRRNSWRGAPENTGNTARAGSALAQRESGI
jgi:hypothetical protein